MKQVRFISNDDCDLKVREPQKGKDQSRTVLGNPIVFGVRSRNITPWSSTRIVYEVLERGCISPELMQRSDVVLNINHSNKVTDIFGRYRNKINDTLKLQLRMDGVGSECELPETTTANDTLVLIKRGDISGMSFAFEDDWEDTENGVSYERTSEMEDGKEVWIRHVKRIVKLYDVSIVTHPAYEQTTVVTREESDSIDAAIEAQLKRECSGGKDKKQNECGGEGETEEEKNKREQAEREANGGETNAEKEEREAKEREANGGETNAEKEEREAREAESRYLQERERMSVQRRIRQRERIKREEDIDNFFV